MNCSFSSGSTGSCGSLGLLGLRVVMGAAFVLHGWPKIQNATGWMGPDSQVPGALQALAAAAEFGGGILLAVGLLTRLAALGIGGVMIGALALVHLPKGDPFVSAGGGPSCEPAAVYLACAILFLCTGAGRYSLDALFCRRSEASSVEPSPPRGRP